MSVPAIELQGIVKDYGQVRALRGIDLSVERLIVEVDIVIGL